MSGVVRTYIPLLLLTTAVASCASPPRPASLAQANQLHDAPASHDAATLAPQAFAHAEALRRQAEQVYQEGQVASSSIIAERAVVAFQRAAAQARVARALKIQAESQQMLEQHSSELAQLQAQQQTLTAEIDKIESLIKVVADAQPIVPSEKTTPEREAARLRVAKTVVADARLLCIAARLVADTTDDLAEAEQEVQRLDELLAKWPRPAPIDDARRARARCLSTLTKARRSSGIPPASGSSDVVLRELSAIQGISPRRDDRGVVATLPAGMASAALDQAVAEVARVAKTHTTFPLLIVGHTSSKPSRADEQRVRARVDSVAAKLRDAGIEAKRIRVTYANGNLPVAAEPMPPPRQSANDRIEIILVPPTS